MGYYVTLEETDAHIISENLAEAYRLMCELNKHDELKFGGRFSGGVQTERWFSWMDPNYPETCSNAQAILEELGFETELDDEGLCIQGYDSKTGQEEIFIKTIAHLMTGYMEWSGEDGYRWKWEFPEFKVYRGETTWVEEV